MSQLYSFAKEKKTAACIFKGLASFMFLLAWFTVSAQAQTTVAGKIVDQESGEGLIGASVYIKGTSSGATTDTDGNFSFQTTVPFPFTLDGFYLQLANALAGAECITLAIAQKQSTKDIGF